MSATSEQYRADLDKRRSDVARMFDGVARRYDLMNTLMTGGLVELWRREVVEALQPLDGTRVLDLAAGTGASSETFAAQGAQVIAADLSFGMLSVGHERRPALSFVNTDALALPFGDGAFDAVTISFGLRNVEDTVGALSELRRVTRPGGRLVVAEFSRPTWAPFRKVYTDGALRAIPVLARLASSNPTAYEYLGESIRAWPDQRALAELITAAGWRQVGWKNLSGGIVALHRATA